MTAAGEKILRSVRSTRAALERGEDLVVHVPPDVDVRAIRRKHGLSQRRFAEAFALGLDAVQAWEQGRRRPEGAARILLKIIEREPEAVRRALAA